MFRRLTLLAFLACAQAALGQGYRDQPCKTPEIARSCKQIHGRLSAGDGTPSTRLWPIGTHHVYGIYSNQYGFAHDGEIADNEGPELHFTLPQSVPHSGGWTVYGDFEVCPLEPPIQGHMQAACIASGTHIVVPKQ
jgi:hypothetical protein